MLSRVANSIYWMSRYLERAENTARFIDVNIHMLLDLPDPTPHQQWAPLVAITGDAASFEERFGNPTQAAVINFLTFDRANPNSIYSCMVNARENARSIREVISSEMWEQINRSFLMLREAESNNRIQVEAASFFSHFKKACHLFTGTTDNTMTHGEAWHFARMGRLLERSDMTSRILDVKYFILLPQPDYVGSPYDSLQWSALLKSASALEMYRKRFGQVTPRSVAEFLVLDRDFPRSMHYCLIKAEESLHSITGSTRNGYDNAAEQRLGRVRAELDYVSMDEIFSTGLHEYLDAFQGKLNHVGEAIGQTFFGIAPANR